MADIQEVNAGGIQAIRQLDAEGFVLETTDGKVYRISLPPGVVGPMGPKGDKGERGVQGDMGSPGADGRDGRDGMNGGDGKDGVSVTLAQVLRNGDLALMLSNGDVINCGKVVGPEGPQGAPGRPGVPGPSGEDGSQIYLTSGPPNPATGQDGDIAIDTANWKLYQKSSLGWGSGNDMLPNSKTLDQAVRSFNGGGGGGRSPRFFGMGAPSMPGGGGGGGTTGAGLEQIIGYGNALPTINSPVLVAVDAEGDAMMIDLWGRSATGTDFVEVAAAKGTGTDSGHTTVFDVQMGPNPPQLSFSTAVIPGINPGDPPQLQVYVQSNQPLLELRGRITKL